MEEQIPQQTSRETASHDSNPFFLKLNSKFGGLLLLLVVLAAIPFTVFVAQQQQETRQRAAEGEISVSTGNYGVVNQTFGVVLEQVNDTSVQTIVNAFPSGNIFVHIKNPQQSFLNSASFTTLSTKNFSFYFSFNSNEAEIVPFLTTLFTTKNYSKQVVVDMENYDQTAIVQQIKTQFGNKVQFNIPLLNVWPNVTTIRDELNQFRNNSTVASLSYQPSYLPDISRRSGLFANIRLFVDTVYDQTYDVSPEGEGIMNIPENITISLTNFGIKRSEEKQKRISYVTGILTSAITIGREAENGNTTKIASIFSGDFGNADLEEQKIISFIGDFIQKKPILVWPQAFAKNGGPYNYDPFKDTEAERVVGVIGKTGNDFYGILTNTSDGAFAISFNGVDFTGYKYYSTTKNTGTIDKQPIVFAPHETMVISKNLQIPSIPPSPTNNPTTPALSGTVSPTVPIGSPTPTPLAYPGSCSVYITAIDESKADANTVTLAFQGTGGTVTLQMGQKGSAGTDTGNAFSKDGYFSSNYAKGISASDLSKKKAVNNGDPEYPSDKVAVNGKLTSFKIYDWMKKFRKSPSVLANSPNASDFIEGPEMGYWYYIDECEGIENGQNKECRVEKVIVSIPKNTKAHFFCSVRDFPKDRLVCIGNPVCAYNDGPDVGAQKDYACDAWKRSCSSEDFSEYIQGVTRPGNAGLQLKAIQPTP